MAEAKSERSTAAARPLSPHLHVYKPSVSMVMSIIHRMTGAALYVGTLILVWVLVAAASGPGTYEYVTGLLGTWPGQLVLVGYTWALFHHMFGGFRHFIWDTGYGYDLKVIDLMSWSTLALSTAATVVVWALALGTGGAP